MVCSAEAADGVRPASGIMCSLAASSHHEGVGGWAQDDLPERCFQSVCECESGVFTLYENEIFG